MQFHLWRKNISHNNVVPSLRNASLFCRILKFIVNIKSYCSHEILTVLKGPASTSESRPWESVCFCSRRQRWEGLLSSLPAPPPSMRGASPWPQGPTSFRCQRILETGWNSSDQAPVSGDCPGVSTASPTWQDSQFRENDALVTEPGGQELYVRGTPSHWTAVSCSRSFCRKGFLILPQHVLLALFTPAKSSLDFSCNLSVLALLGASSSRTPRRTQSLKGFKAHAYELPSYPF